MPPTTDTQPVRFAELVRSHRRRLALTQEELAGRTGISARSIQKLEAGRIATPRSATVRLLADTFGLTGGDREAFCRTAAGGDLPAAGRWVPAQLPADVTAFTGREEQVARLDRLFAATAEQPAAVVISAIAGTAGVGKTALAVHWAHRRSGQFPDGALYVDLHGFGPQRPVAPADALAGFLTALGVAGQDLPMGLDERAAAYRSEVAGRRMLVLLDNAATLEQVRPLLPGTGSCAVVVTSRNRLASLSALHGADRLDLDLLPAADAIALLRRLIGARVDDEPADAAALVAQCARLPLALRVAAELAAARPGSPLAELVAELDGLQPRLELLDAGDDPHAAVKTVFSWSIGHLSPEAAGTFRRLSLHPGPDLDVHAAAALTGLGVDGAGRILTELARAHLVQQPHGGRYSMHDLLRAYADHLATAEDTEAQRQEAMDGMLGYYLAAAAAAMDRWYPAEAHRRQAVPAPPVPLPAMPSSEAARAWLEAERSCLVAAAALAAEAGRASYLGQLSAILYRYLESDRHVDGMAIYRHAYAAAEQANDPAGQAAALRCLGAMNIQTGAYDLATDHLTQALALYRKVEDPTGEATALANLGVIEERAGRYQSAADHHQQALAGFREAGDETGEANTLTNLGICDDLLGRYAQAADRHRDALARYRRLGNSLGEICALNNLGAVELKLGHYQLAADHYRDALTRSRRLEHPHSEAAALDSLGILHLRLGQPGPATDYFTQALAIYRETDNQDGEAWARNGLGEAAHAGGRSSEAVTHHLAALAIATDIGIPDQRARAHAGLGDAHHALGEPTPARTHYEQAIVDYRELGTPEAEQVRARLAAL